MMSKDKESMGKNSLSILADSCRTWDAILHVAKSFLIEANTSLFLEMSDLLRETQIPG